MTSPLSRTGLRSLGWFEAWLSGFHLLTSCASSKQLEEEEQEDKFELTVGVSDPEKVGEFLPCPAARRGRSGEQQDHVRLLPPRAAAPAFELSLQAQT